MLLICFDLHTTFHLFLSFSFTLSSFPISFFSFFILHSLFHSISAVAFSSYLASSLSILSLSCSRICFIRAISSPLSLPSTCFPFSYISHSLSHFTFPFQLCVPLSLCLHSSSLLLSHHPFTKLSLAFSPCLSLFSALPLALSLIIHFPSVFLFCFTSSTFFREHFTHLSLSHTLSFFSLLCFLIFLSSSLYSSLKTTTVLFQLSLSPSLSLFLSPPYAIQSASFSLTHLSLSHSAFPFQLLSPSRSLLRLVALSLSLIIPSPPPLLFLQKTLASTQPL